MPSIKCASCGLVNFAEAEVCRRCQTALRAVPAAGGSPAATAAPAAATAGAPAVSGSMTEREVLGRVSTKHGFQDWVVVALADSIVLTPDSVVGSVLHNTLPMRGLVFTLLASKGQAMAAQTKERLSATPAEQLKGGPDAVVIPLSDLRAIEFTRNIFSAWVEFVRRGGRLKYEVSYMVYTALCDATERRFPALYRGDARTTKLLGMYRGAQKKAARA